MLGFDYLEWTSLISIQNLEFITGVLSGLHSFLLHCKLLKKQHVALIINEKSEASG
jgi:hypothetical protein